MTTTIPIRATMEMARFYIQFTRVNGFRSITMSLSRSDKSNDRPPGLIQLKKGLNKGVKSTFDSCNKYEITPRLKLIPLPGLEHSGFVLPVCRIPAVDPSRQPAWGECCTRQIF
jgi:hypothetical protein